MKISANDDFEHRYTQKFRDFVAPFGDFVLYERDRATRDIGLHFTQYKEAGGKIVTLVLVWFQLKGVMSSRLNLQDYAAGKKVSLSLQTNHLRFWYVAPQPTYLVVFVESAAQFLVINIQKHVRDTWGINILHSKQARHSVFIDAKNTLDEHAMDLILRKNLISALREQLLPSSGNSEMFLRDSSLVMSLFHARRNRKTCRVRVIKYMSKMRTEVYFEIRDRRSWHAAHTHWEFLLDKFSESFPYIDLSLPGSEDQDDWEDDDSGGDAALELPNGQISIVPYGEMMEHVLNVKLNELGVAWAETLQTLEAAEVLVVDRQPAFVSVAPFHRRDL